MLLSTVTDFQKFHSVYTYLCVSSLSLLYLATSDFDVFQFTEQASEGAMAPPNPAEKDPSLLHHAPSFGAFEAHLGLPLCVDLNSTSPLPLEAQLGPPLCVPLNSA